MTTVTGTWLTNEHTRRVCQSLAAFDLYFVGGCVRNALIDAPVADIDLSTNARPKTVMQAAQEAGLKVIPTGIDHGTVTIIAGGIPHEVTTFRRDVATDGRRAVVAFSDKIEEDARRRDFTINALYARPDGAVIDPLEGLPDLFARRIRFIENADQRIKEDYLRILRFFRFHAWYGDADAGLDAEGLAACATNNEGLGALSKERLGVEMLKLLAAPDPAPAVAAMGATGNLAQILPGASPEYMAPLIHLENQSAADPLRRLACLGGQDVQTNLRLSKQDSARLDQIRKSALGTQPPAVLAHLHGLDVARDAILVRSALCGQALPDNLDPELARGAAAIFPIKATDLQPELQGAALGKALKDLKSRWLKADFSLSKQQLLE